MKASSSIVAASAVLLLASIQVITTQSFNPGDDDWFILTNHATKDGSMPPTTSAETDCVHEDYVCATVENQTTTAGTKAVLDACTWESEYGWRTWSDGNAFVLMLGIGSGYSGSPDAICMQAGHGNFELGSRATIRLYPCNISSPLQRFVWPTYGDGCGRDEGGIIKLQSNTTMCLAWSGADPVVPGSTPLIVMPCTEAKGVRSLGWMVG